MRLMFVLVALLLVSCGGGSGKTLPLPTNGVTPVAWPSEMIALAGNYSFMYQWMDGSEWGPITGTVALSDPSLGGLYITLRIDRELSVLDASFNYDDRVVRSNGWDCPSTTPPNLTLEYFSNYPDSVSVWDNRDASFWVHYNGNKTS